MKLKGALVSLAVPSERIEKSILLIRGHKVMLDSDLAGLYGVKTKSLNQAVKRNLDRFPFDFMFQLSKDEVEELNRSQIVTGSWCRVPVWTRRNPAGLRALGLRGTK